MGFLTPKNSNNRFGRFCSPFLPLHTHTHVELKKPWHTSFVCKKTAKEPCNDLLAAAGMAKKHSSVQGSTSCCDDGTKARHNLTSSHPCPEG